MIRLGLSLALSGGRGAVARLALTATAVAVGTAILLYAVSFAPAVTERDGRTAWRDSFIESGDPTHGTLVETFEDHAAGELLIRVHVAPAEPGGAAPVPPGIPRLPAAGEAFVSPALRDRMAATPADELADRIGRVVGTIADTSLASPDELVAIIGTDPAILRAAGAPVVSGYPTTPAPLNLNPIAALIVVLAAMGALAPVAVFVSTATRMSAAQRELRLAALRLVGATPGQVARLAVVEALLATAVGAAGGVALFVLSRPLIARIPLDQTTWWPGTISPPPLLAVTILVAVQVVGAAGALVAMRRLTISPLGVQRRASPPAPRARRVLPLVVSIAVLMAAVSFVRARLLPDVVALSVAGMAFAGVIASIAAAGPWFTSVVGRILHRFARGGSGLLAARRLHDDPRSSFGAIAGVTLAIFVASAFFTFAGYVTSRAGRDTDPLLQPGAVVADLSAGGGIAPSGRGAAVDLVSRVAAIQGVTGVVPVREVSLVRGGSVEGVAWLASCTDVARVLGLATATCPPDGVATTSGASAAGRYTIVPAVADPSGSTPPSATIDVGTGGAPPLMTSEGDLAGFLPAVLIDPTALDRPAAATTFPISRVYVLTDRSAGVGERVRTAIVSVAPASVVRLEEERIAASTQFAEIGRIVSIGLLGTLALAGCSLAVAVTTATLDRRRQFVFLRSAGMTASALRSAILLQAGVPLVTVAAVSALLGTIVGIGVLAIAGGSVALPDASLVGVLIASLVVAMMIVTLTLAPLERMTRPASVRHE